MMSNRSIHLLHENKLNDFLSFAKTIGYEVLETKGFYERFRIKKGKEILIGYQKDKTNHITITDKSIKLFYKYKEDNK